MVRTYLDSNILIAAFRGNEEASTLAFEILDDPKRQFVLSDYLHLEVLPKPLYYNRSEEIEFMQTVLHHAVETVKATPQLVVKAIEFAATYDLSPMDALHAASAFFGNVDEFITLEKASSPLCRVHEISVVSIHPISERR